MSLTGRRVEFRISDDMSVIHPLGQSQYWSYWLEAATQKRFLSFSHKNWVENITGFQIVNKRIKRAGFCLVLLFSASVISVKTFWKKKQHIFQFVFPLLFKFFRHKLLGPRWPYKGTRLMAANVMLWDTQQHTHTFSRKRSLYWTVQIEKKQQSSTQKGVTQWKIVSLFCLFTMRQERTTAKG